MNLIPTSNPDPRPDEATAGTPGEVSGLSEGLVGDWGAIDPLVLAAVAATGVVLLLFGARILRPAVVLGAAALAALVGLRLAAASRADLLPAWIQGIGIPPVTWVIVLPLLGGLVAVALARLALAVLLGVAVATVVLVLGLVVAGGGKAVPSEPSLAVPVAWIPVSGVPVSGQQEEVPPSWSDRMADQVGDQVADQVGDTMRERLGDVAEGLVGDLPELDQEIPAGLRRWWREMTGSVPAATVDLVVALAMVSGICAVLLGLLLPERVAMAGTAIAGAWLMAAAATGAWARFGDGSQPPVIPSILGGAILAGIGIVFQMKQRAAGVKVSRRQP